MKSFYPLIVLLFLHTVGFGQVSLPIDFEGGIVGTADFGPGNFTSFGGGTATVQNNPFASGINSSAKVGRIVRTTATNYAGGYLDLSAPLVFTENSTICMKVYTTAPIGTPVILKLEDGGNVVEIPQSTTVSEEWETICFNPPGAPTNYTRLTFLFNLNNLGTGTYYFDDIEQPPVFDGFEVLLPLDFEGDDFDGDPVADDNFGDINGGFEGANGVNFGAATVIPNPQVNGINTSATVGQIVRHPGSDAAGAYVDLPVNLNFDAYPIICMNVFTDAPAGTEVTLRIEDTRTGAPDIDAVAETTVSGEWEPLCFVYQLAPDSYNRLTFLFDLGNVGDGSNESTFLFDDIEQLITPLGFDYTPGSAYFCPGFPVTFTFPGDGDYEWYADAAAEGTVVGTGSTYTSPPLFSNTTYYVRDITTTALPQTDVGPTALGPAVNLAAPQTATLDFVSSTVNGFWHGVDVVSQFESATAPNCRYTVTGHNITSGASETRVRDIPTTVPANASLKQDYTFPTAIPMDAGDIMQLEVSVLNEPSGTGCRLVSFNIGSALPTIAGYPSTTNGGELTFTGYNAAGVTANTRWMGFDYRVSGEMVDPNIYQVNAIADCANPLPIELLDFSVREDNGHALLNWSTASELNNDRFLLLRTLDGIDFKTIGTVSGAGNSNTELHYSFRDRNPEKGVSYYQLLQVDYDGRESRSDLVSFVNEASDDFVLFPNPTFQDLTLSLDDEYDHIDVLIYDLTGRLITRKTFNSIAVVNFKLEGNPGTYIVEIMANDKRKAIFNVFKL